MSSDIMQETARFLGITKLLTSGGTTALVNVGCNPENDY